MVEQGGRGFDDWVVDPKGRAIAQAAYDDKAGLWKLSVKDPSGRWRAVKTITAPIDTPDLAGMGRSEHSILVDLDDGKVGHAWREVSMETGAWGDPVVAADAQSAIHDPATGLLIGNAVLSGDTRTYDFFDPHDAAVWRSISKAYAGDEVSLKSWSDDRTKIIVRVDSAEYGPAYALVDTTALKASWLGAEYEALKSEDISPVKPVRYKAADGLEISGYLTLPRGRDPRGLPLVVLAHGGPAARDTPGFDWWAQALASRGYAVLQANFRGSVGFGPEFYKAGFGEFGRKMQTDLSDGVRDLARQGLIDPKRVCIVGASYGGYAALAGAALDRGVYRCAMSYAGPSDLRSQIYDSQEKQGREALRYWARFIGARDLDDPVLATISPAAHAADVDIPLLLIHGRDDTVVPIAQSRRMAAAMRRAGKPVELLELKGEDHWLSTGATRLAMLQATVDFLEKNNPPH
jgi:dipeptidyl aminopeptidase/acylaminoacyl peptidase